MEIRNAYFIKLGEGGRWERESIEDGVIRFGYNETITELAEAGRWADLKEAMRGTWGRGEGPLTRHVNQVQIYYESDERDVFITFCGGLMYWCRPSGRINRLEDGSHVRGTVRGWSPRSSGGALLSEERLSGNLTKVQMFRGTISRIRQLDYLRRKLTDQDLPQVAHAKELERAVIESNVELMKLLTWRDFELLVDLVFTSSGWRRIAEVGKTAKTVDIELVLPTTGERAFVQVKSSTNQAQFNDYLRQFGEQRVHHRMFYVWHSGHAEMLGLDPRITLVGPPVLAKMVIDAGLSGWLRNKVA